MTIPPLPLRRLRAIVVIDGTNLKGAIEEKGLTTWVNYRQLGAEILKRAESVGPWTLEGVVYVTASPIQSHDPVRFVRWRKFEEMLRGTERVQLKLGRLEGSRNAVYEKGVDILVALELLRGAYKDEYDVAAIISGDGDYADIARAVREAGKKIVNAFFADRKSYELSKASEEFVDLGKIVWRKIELRRDVRRYPSR